MNHPYININNYLHAGKYIPISDSQLSQFMLQSNEIEGEPGLNPNDVDVARAACLGFQTLDDILRAHKLLTEHLKVDWSGKWRKINVRVGRFVAPDWSDIPNLMKDFEPYLKVELFDSWKSHNEFEKIHPFQDFNGRIGRLIWLSKAIKEGYNFSIPFLQKYYYQTLKNQ